MRAIWSIADSYIHTNGITYRYSNANADTDTDPMHGEMCTHAETAPNTSASAVIVAATWLELRAGHRNYATNSCLFVFISG